MTAGLRDADLTTAVWDCQALNKIALSLALNTRDFLAGPLPAHESLLDLLYRRTLISGGPVIGEQTTSRVAPLPILSHLEQFEPTA
jgi:hypothetical protein